MTFLEQKQVSYFVWFAKAGLVRWGLSFVSFLISIQQKVKQTGFCRRFIFGVGIFT